MAISVAGINGAAYSTDQTTHAVDLSLCQAGQMVFVHFTNDGTATASIGGSGWSNLVNHLSSSNHRHSIWWKIFEGNEGSSVNVTTSASETSSYEVTRVNNPHASQAPNVSGIATGTNANPNAGSVTAAWGAEENLFLWSCGWDTAATINSYPSNYTHAQSSHTATGAGGCGVAVGARILTAASDDPQNGNLSASSRWNAFTIAVRPAAVVSEDGSGTIEFPTLDVTGDGSYSDVSEADTIEFPTLDVTGEGEYSDVGEADTITFPTLSVAGSGEYTPLYTGAAVSVDLPQPTVTGEGTYDDGIPFDPRERLGSRRFGLNRMAYGDFAGRTPFVPKERIGSRRFGLNRMAYGDFDRGGEVAEEGSGTITFPTLAVTGDGIYSDVGGTDTIVFPTLAVTGEGSYAPVYTGHSDGPVQLRWLWADGTPHVWVNGDEALWEQGAIMIGALAVTGEGVYSEVSGTDTITFPTLTVAGEGLYSDVGEADTIEFPTLAVIGEGTYSDLGEADTVTFPTLAVTGEGFYHELYDADAAQIDLTTLSVTGDGTYAALDEVVGAGTLELPTLSVTGEGVYSDSGEADTITFPTLAVTGEGTFSIDYEADPADLDLPTLLVSGTGVYSDLSGADTITFPTLLVAGEGIYSAEGIYDGQGDLQLPTLVVEGSGLYSDPLRYEGIGTLELPRIEVTGEGWYGARRPPWVATRCRRTWVAKRRREPWVAYRCRSAWIATRRVQ